MTTRDQILAAVPAEDADWAEALNRRGIRKENDGWMQYFQGGSATASNRAFAAAFGDYCTARARAASAPKQGKARQAAPVLASREVESDSSSIQAAKKRTSDAVRRASLLAGASDLTAPPADPGPAPADCAAIKERAQTCRDAGMGDGNMGSDFRCRKAYAEEKSSCSGR